MSNIANFTLKPCEALQMAFDEYKKKIKSPYATSELVGLRGEYVRRDLFAYCTSNEKFARIMHKRFYPRYYKNHYLSCSNTSIKVSICGIIDCEDLFGKSNIENHLWIGYKEFQEVLKNYGIENGFQDSNFFTMITHPIPGNRVRVSHYTDN